MKTFPQLLSDFLLEHVSRRRNLSANTAKSYRDSFVLLLKWLKEEQGLPPDTIGISDLDRKTVESFCAWLTDHRGVSTATLNVRVSALRAFAGYVGLVEPAYLNWAAELRAIKPMRSPSKEVKFISPEAVGSIIEAAKDNIRDKALLSLLYDSGARVSEISNATTGDIRLEKPTTIRLMGKGSKVRLVPLCDQVATTLKDYIDESALSAYDPLFKNRGGEAIGRAGIAWILSKYARMARGTRPELVPGKTHPHMLRHSKAMHLLEAGVNLVYIRDFLGHSSVTTTEIYARASTKAKREAIEKASANVIKESPYSKKEKSDLIDWLKTIM